MDMLKSRLKSFKLSGMYSTVDERLSFAKDKALSYQEFLELLLEDEENSRRENSYKKKYSRAKLPYQKRIEDFDFSFQPDMDRRRVSDFATCQFIAQRKNIIFIGKPGVGKSHISVGIAIKALLKGYSVLFTQVSEMLQVLHQSKADNSYYKKLNYYIKPDLIILDELGFKKIPNYSADDFFEVISKRYEKGSIIITTNKNFEEWGNIFADNILASAIIDRIVHHSTVLKVNGDSYRTKDIKKGRGEKI
jgi:DNA replication protein DnaC